VWRTISIIDSHAFVEDSVLATPAQRQALAGGLPSTPSPISVSVSAIPSRSDAAASGQECFELRREPLEQRLGLAGFLERPRAADLAEDSGAVALGQQSPGGCAARGG